MFGRLRQRFFHLSWKKKLLTIGGGSLLLIIGLGMVRTAGKESYTTERPEYRDIIETVSETGKVATNGRTNVYSPTNGIVEKIFVKNGEQVITGQDLFAIQSTATVEEQAAARATYLTAKNSLDTAQSMAFSLQSTLFSKWDIYKKLAENDTYELADNTPNYEKRLLPEFLIAQKEWLAAEANYKKQQSVIAQANAAVQSTYLAYQATQHATVKATADGIVSNISVIPGATVTLFSATSPPVPLLAIASEKAQEIVVSLSENDINKIKEGQEASVSANATRSAPYAGVVRRVDTIGNDVAGVVRYNVYIEVYDASGLLRPGMNADVVIATQKVPHVLSVPNAAIKPYKGGKAVRIPGKTKKDVEYAPVLIGIRGKEFTQILEGIEESQDIIVALSNEQIKRPGVFGN